MAEFSSITSTSTEATTKHDQLHASPYTPPSTPSAITSSAHKLLHELNTIHATLISLPSLAPGPEINTLLTRVVNLCTRPYSTAFTSTFLSLPGVEKLSLSLRPLCATAEGELERHWAGRILASLAQTAHPGCPGRTEILDMFPYRQNYIDLARLECNLLEAFLPSTTTSPTNIAFIGSGPLPLTSFCTLDRYPRATVHNIDRDASALTISQSLSEQLGYGERMTFGCTDVVLKSNTELDERATQWSKFDVVFLAALVGMDSDSKISMLDGLARKLRAGTLVVARSARGVRGIVYPILDLSDELQSAGFEILAEVHPWTDVVNSVVVLRVKER